MVQYMQLWNKEDSTEYLIVCYVAFIVTSIFTPVKGLVSFAYNNNFTHQWRESHADMMWWHSDCELHYAEEGDAVHRALTGYFRKWCVNNYLDLNVH